MRETAVVFGQRVRRRGAFTSQALRRSAARRRLGGLPHAARLHLGAGSVRLDGWVNIDGDPGWNPDLVLDLRAGLPARPGSIEMVYSEHVLEHLDLRAAQQLFADARRALMPGGVMRIAMPDLRAHVQAYLGDWRALPWLQEPAFEYVDTPARMLNVLMREWGHLYVYDEDDLRVRLVEAGFTDIRGVAWGESERRELRGLETRADSALIVEAWAT